nr:hypothetical protein CFP56_16896 [Quercus suber]
MLRMPPPVGTSHRLDVMPASHRKTSMGCIAHRGFSIRYGDRSSADTSPLAFPDPVCPPAGRAAAFHPSVASGKRMMCMSGERRRMHGHAARSPAHAAFSDLMA